MFHKEDDSYLQEFYDSAEEIDRAIDDLRIYIRLAWPIIEPGTTYQDGWHIDAMASHLMAVTNGQIKDLLINVPPRHAKSSIVSILWPTWEWIRNPHTKWLYSSYNQALSVRDNVKARRLILSPWYQKHFGWSFQLAKDQKTKTRYDNTRGGYRIATSVDGGNTGEGGDRIVCLPYEAEVILKYGKMAIGRVCEEGMPVDVLSYNKLRRKTEFKRIKMHFITESKEMTTISFVNKRPLEITPNHLVYTTSRGYVAARDITPMDCLMDEYKKDVRVKQVVTSEMEKKTYNIEVSDNNNYFANGLLVHNCDDGNNNKDAESQAVLESTAIWWRETMSTRKNDPQRSTRVMVAQRTSYMDLSAVMMEMGECEHLCLPAEYEGSKKVTSLGWSDPRTEDGELLWPQRFTRPVIDSLKKELGMYGTAGQLQQRPTPRGGGIIKKDWFRYFRLTRDAWGRITHPQCHFICQSWDTAFKTGEENDYSVCLTFGVGAEGYYLLGFWKAKAEMPELEKKSIELASLYAPNVILIEDKASGQSLVQVMKKRNPKLPIKAVVPQNDKTARMHSISPYVEAGQLWLPEDAHWLDEYIETMTKFPAAVHDDEADATSQAILWLAPKFKSTFDQKPVVVTLGR